MEGKKEKRRGKKTGKKKKKVPPRDPHRGRKVKVKNKEGRGSGWDKKKKHKKHWRGGRRIDRGQAIDLGGVREIATELKKTSEEIGKEEGQGKKQMQLNRSKTQKVHQEKTQERCRGGGA